jgi:hypothetical protein
MSHCDPSRQALRPHFHFRTVQPQPKKVDYWRRPYVDLVEFRHLKPLEAEVLFPRAVDGIVYNDTMYQVEFVVIAPRVRVSGLDNGDYPSDVNAFNTKLFFEFSAQRGRRWFARLDVAARKKEPRLSRRLG